MYAQVKNLTDDLRVIRQKLDTLDPGKFAEELSLMDNVLTDLADITVSLKEKTKLNKDMECYIDGTSIINVCDHPLKFLTQEGNVETIPFCGFAIPRTGGLIPEIKNQLEKFWIDYKYIRLVGSLISAKHYEPYVVCARFSKILPEAKTSEFSLYSKINFKERKEYGNIKNWCWGTLQDTFWRSL